MTRRAHRTGMTARIVACACALAAVVVSAPAHAQTPPVPQWAPAASATIHPGVQLHTLGSQCTANFVFYDATDVYIGSAAHCAEDSDAAVGTANSACSAVSLPYGTPVEVDDRVVGELAYSSYKAMADAKETDRELCGDNDFAVVRIAPGLRKDVNPTMPFWGGPTGLRQTGLRAYEKVMSYGNSGLRAGIEQTSPKEGFALGDTNDGWSHWIWTATPGIFGDSGSGAIDASGNAFGILSTISPVGGTNYASDVAKSLDYLHRRSALRLRLALGTESFRGPLAGPGGSPSPPPQPQPDPGGGAPPQGGQPPADGAPPSSSGSSAPPEGAGQGSAGSEPGRGEPAPTGRASDAAPARLSIAGVSGSRVRGTASGVARVEVSLKVKRGSRCSVLRAARLVRSTCTARAPWVRVTGLDAWTLRLAGAPRGRVTVRARGLDRDGRTIVAASRRLNRP